MIFTSFSFLLFFPVVVILFYLCPRKFRGIYLLLVSYLFYINLKAVYALLLAGVTLTTYFSTRQLERSVTEKGKKCWMLGGVFLVLCPLFFFKYYDVVNDAVVRLLSSAGIYWPLPEISCFLPVGISFYTFMAIGYILDVYNEEIEVERNAGRLGLFVSFFPLLLSGPIERAGHMLPQFRSFERINYGNITAGLKLMLWGYFMKLVVADRLGVYIDTVYANVPNHNGTTLALASLLYPFQVYGDLGGYSLIAIGTAKCLGMEVMQNFKRPFFATSMSELWRRWHISLIKWLTDYIYTPLAFKYRGLGMRGIVIALMVTFLISGLWHGATLAFILWGLLQGIFLSVEAVTNKRRTAFEKKYNLLRRPFYIIFWCVITYLLFTFSQIFGRADSASDAFVILRKIFFERGSLFADNSILGHAFLGMVILFTKDFLEEYMPGKFRCFENNNIAVRFMSYVMVLALILALGVLNGAKFIYFQF